MHSMLKKWILLNASVPTFWTIDCFVVQITTSVYRRPSAHYSIHFRSHTIAIIFNPPPRPPPSPSPLRFAQWSLQYTHVTIGGNYLLYLFLKLYANQGDDVNKRKRFPRISQFTTIFFRTTGDWSGGMSLYTYSLWDRLVRPSVRPSIHQHMRQPPPSQKGDKCQKEDHAEYSLW